MSQHPLDPLARRAFIAAAGLGLGAGLTAPLARAQVQRQSGAESEAPSAAAQSPAQQPWNGEYWAKRGDVSLCLYRKRIGAPAAGSEALPLLFLVHGSSISARPSFDLAVPGKGEYSLMNVFARYGFDVWTMDLAGYGRSSRTAGNSDVASGVADLKAAMTVVQRQTGRSRMHVFGESSGAIRAGAFAQSDPTLIDRLVLVAFTYKGTGSPTLKDRAKELDYFRTHNTRLRDRAMIRSIFTRDKLASAYDPAMIEALADAELKFGNQVPTGTYLDMTANLPLVDPAKVRSPVLLARGDHDGIATLDDLTDFFKQLANGDRQFAILPNTAHSIVLGRNRALLWHVMREFLTMPAPAAT